ncbi:MAG: exodeoxyribonuclease VII large subunit, partial [Proteobacteria bacterium]|nr:exodeoxyribonuclease VII large subunit [Pseudomonadota bacterium]
SESVALSIFNSDIPVITGIGHETDFTIADFVADLRAPTPSAAAELAFPDKSKLIEQIHRCSGQITASLSVQYQSCKKSLNQLTQRLKTPLNKVYDFRFKLEDDQARLQNALNHCIRHHREKLWRLSGFLDALNPKAVLKRGYSISRTLKDKKLIFNSNDVRHDERIQIILHQGELIAKVQK